MTGNNLQSKDLRIGNILNSDTGLVEVIGIPFNQDLQLDAYPIRLEQRQRISRIMPVLFTEKWLPKFGITNSELLSENEDAKVWSISIGPYVRLSFRKLNPDGVIVKLHTADFDQIPLPFVHQFQNLYHALMLTDIKIDYFVNEPR